MTKLGIRLKTSSANGGTLMVDHVSPNGRLALSPIRADDRLVSLDNHNCGNCWTPTMADRYSKECVGFVYIVTTNASEGDPKAAQATVYKSQPQDKLGIVFVTDEDNGKLRIKSLNAIGLLGSRSVLQVGDYVESINNVPCSEVDTALALNIIRSSENLVTIQVRNANTNTNNNNTKNQDG
jgi:PDZ domain-containing secreted protein